MYEWISDNDNQKEPDTKKLIVNGFNVYEAQKQVKLIYGVEH